MRPLPLLLSASLLGLAFGAGAQDLPYPREMAPVSTVQVTAPIKPVWLTTEQEENVGGAYAMSNGWRLNVETSTDHINARIDNQRPLRLVAVSPDKFVSRDGNVTMEFNRGSSGTDMVMSYVPNPLLGQVIVISSTLAQR
ncbi:hypothetical protein G4G28_04470 [Massilia sp. Dwa41.01b]|uniref:hypothetical protein n=1 Tax=unclassified Massilia TaxID=2609279 RepID=UPI001603C721|nr:MULTISPECIES: hypothetical protein [unclassified Massilia]QNA87905.1 hypothetical protein G4G28_04470 [Massilia sp. Dwa41.01b]QNA98808.1 hypothetical protein G4G31_08190 [Massilia sp. Se16.2.3]